MIIAAAALLVAQASVADLSSPEHLFKSVCMSDQVALPSERFEPAGFSALPKDALAALNFAVVLFVSPLGVILPENHPAPLTPADVPNTVLVSIPDRALFLITPAPQKDGRAATQCGVIWRGHHYHDALKTARTLLPTDEPWSPKLGENSPWRMRMLRVEYGGGVVVAAETSGWTVLTVAPAAATNGQGSK